MTNLPPRGWGYRPVNAGRPLTVPPRAPGGSAGVSVGRKDSRATDEAKDYRRAVAIDYTIIAAAQEFYKTQGFDDCAVPWVIGGEAYEETRPKDALAYETLGGFLVASGEQSFLQLLLNGEKVGRAQATTPCFRDEAHDEIHSPYFLKTELIDTLTVTQDGVEAVLLTAQTFFETYLSTRIEKFEDNTFDLVCAESGLELGSYGLRRHGKHSWVYGTGVALPRLSQALAKLS